MSRVVEVKRGRPRRTSERASQAQAQAQEKNQPATSNQKRLLPCPALPCLPGPSRPGSERLPDLTDGLPPPAHPTDGHSEHVAGLGSPGLSLGRHGVTSRRAGSGRVRVDSIAAAAHESLEAEKGDRQPPGSGSPATQPDSQAPMHACMHAPSTSRFDAGPAVDVSAREASRPPPRRGAGPGLRPSASTQLHPVALTDFRAVASPSPSPARDRIPAPGQISTPLGPPNSTQLVSPACHWRFGGQATTRQRYSAAPGTPLPPLSLSGHSLLLQAPSGDRLSAGGQNPPRVPPDVGGAPQSLPTSSQSVGPALSPRRPRFPHRRKDGDRPSVIFLSGTGRGGAGRFG
ncbi:hypothetical protein Mp_4g08330 [Marchantia polymorpha subsp. ruderalis]|uniref:Uncharacterized protein n=2 Tax=Marchantia polymorpha TaxID=3197 RepID=A0AAF6B7Q8_MARPO|nr:hypothetical protein MARPO_0120s0013 [Marchantia polymorpha]BBN08042.1 hypothetical protein Mp_4g08330 [Marchantia polymorpha subsp. ruderalis]|eukprot:PTQ30730.1 hypothetical protein MARPO_0120s0013 [Marchantia polymorpha]